MSGDALHRLRSLRHPVFTARFANLGRAVLKLEKIYGGYPLRYDRAELEQ
ncbi:MAG: hypothetical protein SWK76_17835 [Actinomycetota bacterium]|nr:hypothetical protein [Actinomycetota bacterium]